MCSKSQLPLFPYGKELVLLAPSFEGKRSQSLGTRGADAAKRLRKKSTRSELALRVEPTGRTLCRKSQAAAPTLCRSPARVPPENATAPEIPGPAPGIAPTARARIAPTPKLGAPLRKSPTQLPST